MNQRRWPWKWIVAAAALVAVGAGVVYILAPMADWSGLVEEWVADKGALGVVAFVAVYVVATLLLLPSSVLNAIAGALFGIAWGLCAVMTGAMAAALAAFLVARHVLRDRIKEHYTRKGTPAAIDRALRAEGWRAVALLRVSPVIPFAVKNYLFGVSRVRMRDYLLGTFVGKLPGALVFTALGATGRAAWEMPDAERWALIAAGIAATAAVTWLVGRTVRRRLEAG
jgi:uncharacterized membrane protein YdjX (TVP38/TMEM64 family)